MKAALKEQQACETTRKRERIFTRHPTLYAPKRDVEILEWRARSFMKENNEPQPKDFENENSTCEM